MNPVSRARLALPLFMPLRLTDPKSAPTFCQHGIRPEFCPYCNNKPKRV